MTINSDKTKISSNSKKLNGIKDKVIKLSLLPKIQVIFTPKLILIYHFFIAPLYHKQDYK